MNRHFKNFLFFLLGFGLIFVAGIASAEGYRATYNGTEVYAGSADAACVALWQALGQSTDYVHAEFAFDYGNGVIQYKCTSKPKPPGQLGSASNIVCPEGQTANPTTGVCEDEEPACPDAWTPAGKITVDTGWKTGPANTNAPYVGEITNKSTMQNYIKDGCEVVAGGGFECYTHDEPSANGYYYTYCTYDGFYTGNEANEGANPDPDPPAEPSPANDDVGGCPPGTTQTGMDADGLITCTGTGTPDTSTDKTTSENTQQNSDGSSTHTKTETKKNADGSTTTTTTTTTTNPDGSTSSNVTKSTGAATDGTDGKEDSEGDDFCKLNPQLSICKESSWKGGCGAFVCEGDAIQCAIAKEQHTRNCELFQENEFSSAAKSIASGNDPLAGTLPDSSNAEIVNVQTSLNDSGLGLTRQCFADKSFTVQGRQVTIPFSEVCPYLESLRYVSLIIGLLVSWRIISAPVIGRA